MKCPSCSNNEFIKIDNPINDQYARLIGECYVCVHCGRVEWFDKASVEFYRTRLEIVNQLKQDVKEKELAISKLKQRCNDLSINAKQLEKYKAELKQRLEWGEGGSKRTRALKEMIAYEEGVLIEGKDPSIEKEIKSLEGEIVRIKEKIEEYSRPIKLVEGL